MLGVLERVFYGANFEGTSSWAFTKKGIRKYCSVTDLTSRRIWVLHERKYLFQIPVQDQSISIRKTAIATAAPIHTSAA